MAGDSSPIPAATRPGSKSGGLVVPHRARWHQRLAARVVYLAIHTVNLTLRRRWDDRSEFIKDTGRGPAIYCVWHNRLALCMIGYWGYVKKHNDTPGLAAMVSASKDGGFLTGVLECFHVEPVRGSSSRRGPQALLELTNWAKRGYDLAITPDGPRGPRYEVQAGVISLAQVTGLPIVPFAYNLDWKITVKSWDGFQIPLPFSRCEMIFDKPIRVPREAAAAEREELRLRVEASLRAIARD
jgi:hypothetical protein